MLPNVSHLQVGVECRYAVMEGLRVVLQLTAQVAHPVDVELACAYVESPWVEALTEGLGLNEAVEDAIHGDLGLEHLIARSYAFHQVLAQRALLAALSVGLLNGSLILEGAASFTVAHLAILCVAQQLSHGLALLALAADEGQGDALDDVSLVSLLDCLLLFLLTSQRQVDQFFLSCLFR